MWLKMNALATIGRFRHHPTFASYIMKSIHTHINMARLITKNTNRRSRWQVQVAFLISHTLQSGLDRKLRAFELGKKNEIKIVSVCVFVFQKKKKKRRRSPAFVSYDCLLFRQSTVMTRHWRKRIEKKEQQKQHPDGGGRCITYTKKERKKEIGPFVKFVRVFLLFSPPSLRVRDWRRRSCCSVVAVCERGGPYPFFSLFFFIFSFFPFSLSFCVCVWSCFSSGGGLSVAAASGRRLLSGSPVALELPHPSHLIGWRPIGEQDACLHHRTAANTTRPKKKVQYIKIEEGGKGSIPAAGGTEKPSTEDD